MPSNRFDTSQTYQPVSSYVPLPFETIGNLGAKMQQGYDNAIGDSYKLNDVMTQVNAIHDPQLGLSNIKKKQELDARYHPKIQAITDKIVAGDPNATRELEKVKREFINDPDRQELENSYLNYKAYKEDKTKKGGKYDSLLDDYHSQQLVGENGELKPFRYSGMEDSLDIESRFSKAMDGIKDDIKGWDVEHIGPDGIKIGNKGKQAGITPDKVLGVAKNKVSDMLRLTDEGKQFAKKLRKLNPGISEEQILNEGIKSLFSSASEQIGMEKTSGNSVSLTDMWSRNQDKGDEIQKQQELLRNSSIEGLTGDLTQADPNAAKLFEQGIFKKNNDGSFDFNQDALTKNDNIDYRAYQGVNLNNSKEVNDAIIKSAGSNSNVKEKQDLFNKQMIKMSNVVGIDPKELYSGNKLNTEKIKEVVSKYNNLTKSRISDLSLSPAVQNSETKNANLNWGNLKEVDPTNPNKSLETTNLKEDEEVVVVNRRTDSDGKVYNEGYIKDSKTGEKVRDIAYRSNSIEKNLVFDAYGQIQKASIDDLTNNKKYDKKTEPIETPYGKVSMNIISEQPVGKGYYIQALSDPQNKQNTIYVIRDQNDDHKIISQPRQSLSELKKDIENFYYTEIPEGRTELENIKALSTQSKDLQNAR